MTNLPPKMNEPWHGCVTKLRQVTLGKTVHANRRVSCLAYLRALSVTLVMACFGFHSTMAQTANPSLTKYAPLVRQAGVTQQSGRGTIEQSPAHKYFTDVVLVNQEGKQIGFYSDLIKDKVVIINSFFATVNHNLEKLQQALGEHIEKDVHIISINVDPTVDTPASLKEYARKLNAKPSWYFLTGDKRNVEVAQNKVGQFVEHKKDHTNLYHRERADGFMEKGFRSGSKRRITQSC